VAESAVEQRKAAAGRPGRAKDQMASLGEREKRAKSRRKLNLQIILQQGSPQMWRTLPQFNYSQGCIFRATLWAMILTFPGNSTALALVSAVGSLLKKCSRCFSLIR
jgi:hypothetical protein